MVTHRETDPASLLSQLRRIPLSFDNQDSDNSCLHLLYQLSSDWNDPQKGEVKFKQLTDGITNTIIKATQQRPGQSEADVDENAVLIRAYGAGTEDIIDREKELRAHALLATRNLAAPLLARFENGFIYGFVPGDPCNPEDFHNPETSRQIAKRLGQCHGSLPISALTANSEPGRDVASSGDDQKTRPVPNIWTNAEKWIASLPDNTPELRSRNETLTNELDWLVDKFANTRSLGGRNYVFSHTDLLCANVILERPTNDKQAERPVTFIDFEYATTAPAAFDVSNLFAEWAGPDGELSWMPSRSQRLHFIEEYVRSFHEHNDISASTQKADMEKDVQQLYEQVELFRGLPGFYWGIWGLIQASISDIDFDYTAYSARRHSEYWGWKEEYEGSREREGRDMTVREKCWARE